MSVHFSAAGLDPIPKTVESDPDCSSSDEDDDQGFDDWVSDSGDSQPCKSLFDDSVLPSAQEALSYDKEKHGFNLDETCAKLSLDFHQRVRLINYIRKEKPQASSFSSLSGSEAYLSADEYLVPVVENDPLLQIQSGDWSDSEPDNDTAAPSDLPSALGRIRALEKKLTQAKQDYSDYRSFVGERLDVERLTRALADDAPVEPAPGPRDDDSHYFESYGENDIHAIMIQDRVRTSTYAAFIMRNPGVFRDAIVLDVGCGTGILSLFAARAGAKRVFAVDASPIALKAAQIVKDNNLGDVITVIRGKVEEIALPFPAGHTHVDIIISEWMGYALLYESMLDSVLVARDRFLRPAVPGSDDAPPRRAGIIAPSQCKMMLGLCDGKEVYKERVKFWGDVYGFDLSVMADTVYEDAIVDVVSAESMLSDPVAIKDIYLPDTTTRSLSFTAPFTLTSTASRRTKVHALLLYFDTFFAADGAPVPADAQVQIVRDGDLALAEVWPLGAGRRRESSQGPPAARAASPSPIATPAPADEKDVQRPPMPRKPSLKRVSTSASSEAGLSASPPAHAVLASVAEGAAPLSASPPSAPAPVSLRTHGRRESLGDGLKTEKVVSFSTGPWSVPTHWKQAVFLLREPITVEEGTVVAGTFHCRKSADNKRELDVEIHYEVRPAADADTPSDVAQADKGKGKQTERVVQMFKVR